MTITHRAFTVGLLAGVVIMWIGQARAHGLAEWIRQNPQTSWCCTPGDDCLPRPGQVRWTPDGYVVDGLKGAKKDGDRGFFRIPTLDQPWACQFPGTNNLNCIFMPDAEG